MKKFNAKLLLFGEYGLMFGAKALAVPFFRFCGSLEFAENNEKPEEVKASQLEIDHFVSFLRHQGVNQSMNFPLELDQIKTDLSNGLYFKSDIPLQYGVGSSAALCAALYDHYGHCHNEFEDVRGKKNLLAMLKHDFAAMEAYFHGKSSGFDPLVSFMNRPVLLDGEQILLPETHLKTPGYSVFLIDTKVRSSTAPLVRLFVEKMKGADYKNRFQNEFLVANDAAINAFLDRNTKELFQQLQVLSAFQLHYFSEMIPDTFRLKIEALLEQNIPVKLLGSGGGGYLLAFVKDGAKLDIDLTAMKVF